MPGRGADERQADEQRHHRAEAEELDGHEPLVVVEGEGQVEGAATRAQEDRVGGERALRIDAARARRRDRGHDLVPLLVPEGALLARVRVEPRDREPRPGDAQVAEGRVGQHEAVEHAVLAHVVAHGAQRHVVREQHEAHRAEEEEHRRLRPAELAQDLRLPLVAVAGRVHRLLVERRRDHGVDLAREREPPRLARVVDGRLAEGGVHLAPAVLGHVDVPVVDQLDRARAALGLGRLRDGADREADAG